MYMIHARFARANPNLIAGFRQEFYLRRLISVPCHKVRVRVRGIASQQKAARRPLSRELVVLQVSLSALNQRLGHCLVVLGHALLPAGPTHQEQTQGSHVANCNCCPHSHLLVAMSVLCTQRKDLSSNIVVAPPPITPCGIVGGPVLVHETCVEPAKGSAGLLGFLHCLLHQNGTHMLGNTPVFSSLTQARIPAS